MDCGKVCRTLLWLYCVSFLLGCSMEANLGPITTALDDIAKTQSTNADFIDGQIVTTGNGVVVKGTFGEIGERQSLSNGVVIEGSFYE